MMTCSARRGFLSLSTCGAPATRPCSSCGRLTCTEHLSPASGFTQCLECANRDQPADENRRPGTDDDTDSAYRTRDSYYSDRDYSPMRSSFDRNDTRGFQNATAAGAGAAALHDDDHPGFGDS
ncbi:MAG: hypothetical protein ABI672_08225 [Vicinamibacteria bacterium]